MRARYGRRDKIVSPASASAHTTSQRFARRSMATVEYIRGSRRQRRTTARAAAPSTHIPRRSMVSTDGCLAAVRCDEVFGVRGEPPVNRAPRRRLRLLLLFLPHGGRGSVLDLH